METTKYYLNHIIKSTSINNEIMGFVTNIQNKESNVLGAIIKMDENKKDEEKNIFVPAFKSYNETVIVEKRNIMKTLLQKINKNLIYDIDNDKIMYNNVPIIQNIKNLLDVVLITNERVNSNTFKYRAQTVNSFIMTVNDILKTIGELSQIDDKIINAVDVVSPNNNMFKNSLMKLQFHVILQKLSIANLVIRNKNLLTMNKILLKDNDDQVSGLTTDYKTLQGKVLNKDKEVLSLTAENKKLLDQIESEKKIHEEQNKKMQEFINQLTNKFEYLSNNIATPQTTSNIINQQTQNIITNEKQKKQSEEPSNSNESSSLSRSTSPRTLSKTPIITSPTLEKSLTSSMSSLGTPPSVTSLQKNPSTITKKESSSKTSLPQTRSASSSENEQQSYIEPLSKSLSTLKSQTPQNISPSLTKSLNTPTSNSPLAKASVREIEQRVSQLGGKNYYSKYRKYKTKYLKISSY